MVLNFTHFLKTKTHTKKNGIIEIFFTLFKFFSLLSQFPLILSSPPAKFKTPDNF